jgi:hypothetical protein
LIVILVEKEGWALERERKKEGGREGGREGRREGGAGWGFGFYLAVFIFHGQKKTKRRRKKEDARGPVL